MGEWTSFDRSILLRIGSVLRPKQATIFPVLMDEIGPVLVDETSLVDQFQPTRT